VLFYAETVHCFCWIGKSLILVNTVQYVGIFTGAETCMEENMDTQSGSGGRAKFIIGGLLIVSAIGYLIYSSTMISREYFYTIEEIAQGGDAVHEQNLRISGAVIGDTIEYDAETLTLIFMVAHIPGDNAEIEEQGGLAYVLHQAVENPGPQLQVVHNGPMPDLLQNEAQAIMTGRLGEDGVFYADELLLKCPTKYEEAIPDQTEG
jgi:cytochrome c-type biogenesis protein CcmE